MGKLLPGTQPDVSCLMALLNHRRYSHTWNRCIQSALDHQYDIGVELVVCTDDAENDRWELLQIADQYPGRVIVAVGQNKGPGAAFDECARLARGRNFIMLTARGWFEPDSLSMLSCALDENEGVDFVYGQTSYHGNLQPGTYTPPPVFRKEDFFKSFVSRYAYMFRREAWHDWHCRFHPTDWQLPDGRWTGLNDRDFQLQMIVNHDAVGLSMPDLAVLNYWYDGKEQTTAYTAKFAEEMNAIWDERWPMAPRR